MEMDLVKVLAEGGPLLTALILILYWNRKEAKERIERERTDAERLLAKEEERHEESRMDKTILINALSKNTQILTELTTLVKRLNGRGQNGR